MVRVTDVHGHHEEHSKQSDAWIISLPADYPYGVRQYTAEDLGGHHWTLSQAVADIDPTTWDGISLKD